MREYTDNPGHIILEFYRLLEQVWLTRSEKVIDIWERNFMCEVASWVVEQLKT